MIRQPADTSVWVDYFNGVDAWQADSLERALTEETVLMGDIILAEILQGFDKDSDYRKAKQALDPLEGIRLGDKELAIKAVSNFSFLRSRGVTIRKTIDMLIGTWCIETDIELLHSNKDFDKIAGHLPLNIVSGS